MSVNLSIIDCKLELRQGVQIFRIESYTEKSITSCLSVNLSFCLSVSQSVCLSAWLSICLSACLSMCLSICQSACLLLCPSLCLFICIYSSQSVSLSVCLYVSLCVFFGRLSVCICVTVYLSVYLLLWSHNLCPKIQVSSSSPHAAHHLQTKSINHRIQHVVNLNYKVRTYWNDRVAVLLKWKKELIFYGKLWLCKVVG